MFDTIVFAYDGSAECQEALAEGIALASRFEARCYLLAVVPAPSALALAEGPIPTELVERDESEVMEILQKGVERLRRAGIDAYGHLASDESPARAIGDYAREVKANLVIVGHHQRSAVKRWWYGSVGHSLLDHLPCSLLVSMPHAGG